jgi:hypothetical protein
MIAISMMIFGDKLTYMSVIGVAISICGIMAYTYYKLERRKQQGMGKLYSRVDDGTRKD